MAFQRRFLDHYLKGIDTGFDREPSVLMHTRKPFSSEFDLRKEQSWPLPDTKWTKIFLSATQSTLRWEIPQQSTQAHFNALEEPLTFTSPPLRNETEITGPLAAKIYASSSTEDMDLFLTFQAFSEDGREVDFQGTV